MKKIILAAVLAAGVAMSTPAAAQDSAYVPGTYMDVQGIFVEDGQFENYMDYIAGRYRESQEFARRQGWITGYRIFANVNRRADEPDLYLLTEYPRLATPEQQVTRERELNRALNETTRQATEGSGQRVRMRRLGSNIMLQELRLRPQRQ